MNYYLFFYAFIMFVMILSRMNETDIGIVSLILGSPLFIWLLFQTTKISH